MRTHAIPLVKRQRTHRRRGPAPSVFSFFAKAVVIWLIAAGIELSLHETPVSFWLRQQAYTYLQSHIQLERSADYPVAIIDLSRLRSTNALSPIDGSPGVFYKSSQDFTDRAMLGKLVQELSLYDPACIGIDIDFSPLTPAQGSNGAPPPGEIDFMDGCLNLTNAGGKAIPVFLGVMRTLHMKPEGWLDSGEYIPMAAAIARFRGRSSHMPFEIFANPEATNLSSLSKSCVDAWLKNHQKSPSHPPKWMALFVQGQSKERIAGLPDECWITAVPVDYYSTLPTLERARFHAEDLLLHKRPAADLDQQLHGKMVMIGYATRLESYDTVTIPNEPDPVPGIYMHACAATTMVSKPLFEINEVAGFGLSFVISLLIASCVFWLRAKYSEHEMKVLGYELLLVFAMMIITCFLVAVPLVRYAGILWLQVTSVWLFLAFEFCMNILAHREH